MSAPTLRVENVFLVWKVCEENIYFDAKLIILS